MGQAKSDHEFTIVPGDGESRELAFARASVQPTLCSAITITAYTQSFEDIELGALVQALDNQVAKVSEGDLQCGEEMLAAQAHTLDAIFNNLAQRAITAKYVDQMDRFLKLALRAQSQCRATWETVATIKYPPVAGYVGQANIAHGPQQVNNEVSETEHSTRARKKLNQENKLLEKNDGEWLDSRAESSTGRTHPSMAAMGGVNRAEDGGG